ncbi:hypothetical protein WICMUC_004588 [Wickerhamomyces mucosus]|uniref:Pre-rRNA-processing protein ESF2 n=1 Tax=Wickerhamomyces mucosus TaxID=1378264 RepID=A0A9P8PGE5_9ASCO|nr:hypothetical protein WICMUC_004588 [Wickerhamomyces mucosus]
MEKYIGNISEDEDETPHLGSDEEFFSAGAKALNTDEEDEIIDADDEEILKTKTKLNKSNFDAFQEQKNDGEDMFEVEETLVLGSRKESDEEKNVNELFRKSKLTKLKNQKPKGKTGVVYLSKIPPYMKPAKLRQILSRFGDVDRLFLRKESQIKYKQRVSQGGNKKDMYEEGWAEFIKKKDAKLCAESLNGNILGGKKGNFYYDDIMNIKYLSGFKWTDLTEKMSKENEVRQSKLQMEISQANKLNSTFVKNVEKSKMVENIKSKKKARTTGEDESDFAPEVRRTFEQRKILSKRADADSKQKEKNNEKLDNVLSRVF